MTVKLLTDGQRISSQETLSLENIYQSMLSGDENAFKALCDFLQLNDNNGVLVFSDFFSDDHDHLQHFLVFLSYIQRKNGYVYDSSFNEFFNIINKESNSSQRHVLKYILANLYYTGFGVTQSDGQSTLIATSLTEENYAPAFNLLGRIACKKKREAYKNNQLDIANQCDLQAEKNFRKAAELGYKASRYTVALLKKDLETMKSIADNNNIYACFYLANYYSMTYSRTVYNVFTKENAMKNTITYLAKIFEQPDYALHDNKINWHISIILPRLYKKRDHKFQYQLMDFLNKLPKKAMHNAVLYFFQRKVILPQDIIDYSFNKSTYAIHQFLFETGLMQYMDYIYALNIAYENMTPDHQMSREKMLDHKVMLNMPYEIMCITKTLKRFKTMETMPVEQLKAVRERLEQNLSSTKESFYTKQLKVLQNELNQLTLKISQKNTYSNSIFNQSRTPSDKEPQYSKELQQFGSRPF